MNSDATLYLTLTAILGLVGARALFAGSRCGRKTRRWWVVVSAIGIAARLIALFTISASDDINRYVWEGKIVASGRSPYIAPADDPMWNEDRDAWWDGMNHRSETTVYPPLTQLLGAGVTALHEGPLGFKIIALLFDLAIALLLVRTWGQSGVSQACIAAFWILNPVPIISFAGEGHFDASMVFFSLGALACGQKQRWKTSWALLGTAIAIKWIALVMLPLWILKSRGQGAWAALPILILPALPLWETLPQLANGLLHFGSAFGSNNPLHYALTAITGSRAVASTISAALLGSWTLFILFRSRHESGLAKASAQLWSGLILCLPTVTYWYAAWLLPFVALTRSRPWWIFSVTSILYYGAAWHAQTTGEWHHPSWAVAWTWVPLYLALLLDSKRKRS